MFASAASAQMGPPPPGPRCLPGSYDGGQTEVAAQLELGPDHRFHYALSYGALDEVAQGKWEAGGAGTVLLTSDPTTPPAFVLLSEAVATARGTLRIDLDVPIGISRQYFSALVRLADGRSSVRQFDEDGLVLELGAGDRVVSVTLLLSVLSLESEAIAVKSGEGSELHVRFDPNDLGKVAFAATPLRIDRDDLLLERHERLIRFRRSGDGC